MYINSVYRVLLAIVVSSVLLCACSEPDDELSTQREQIVTFLEGSHQPPLIAESQIADEGDLPYYTPFGRSVFRYIENAFSPDRLLRAEVTTTSKVTITFRAYIFENRAITDDTFPYYSNDPLLEGAYRELGLTGEAWSFEPIVIDMAAGNTIKGVQVALVGCREGDDVEVYMAYDAAYGDIYFSTLPLNSPIAWIFNIESVD